MIPGELVELRLRPEDPGWADLGRVLRGAPGRRTPPCPEAGRCGGCHWQHMEEPTQRRWRRHRLLALLGEMGVAETSVGEDLWVASPLGYRCRVRLQVGAGGALGFHGPGSRKVAEIASCPLMAPDLQQAYRALRKVLGRDPGAWREVSGVEIIALPGTRRPLARLNPRDRAPRRWRDLARCLIDEAGFAGVDVQGGESPEGAAAVLGAIDGGGSVAAAVGGFVQAHLAAAQAMAGWIVRAAGAAPGVPIVELYAGSGFLGWRLAAAGAEVVSVEADSRTLAAAEMLPPPGAGVWTRRAERAEAYLDGEAVGVEVLVADPPRSGLGPALEPLLAAAPRRLVLVYCSMPGLARDLPPLLRGGYRLLQVQPCDLFPQTRHQETVVVLERVRGPRPGR